MAYQNNTILSSCVSFKMFKTNYFNCHCLNRCCDVDISYYSLLLRSALLQQLQFLKRCCTSGYVRYRSDTEAQYGFAVAVNSYQFLMKMSLTPSVDEAFLNTEKIVLSASHLEIQRVLVDKMNL